jgi:hypothetical protein
MEPARPLSMEMAGALSLYSASNPGPGADGISYQKRRLAVADGIYFRDLSFKAFEQTCKDTSNTTLYSTHNDSVYDLNH